LPRAAKFTLVCLTSRIGRIDHSLNRWCIPLEFDPYTVSEIEAILFRLASGLGIRMTVKAAGEFALRCGGSPGNAAVLIQRIGGIISTCGLNGLTIDMPDVPVILAELGYDANFPESLPLQDALKGMAGREFENWAAAPFRRQGYTVNFTETTGDHGIDLILIKDGQTSAVQCKRWSDSVGEPVLRDFYGALVSAGISSGIVMTTSTFTASAKEFARGAPIRLLDLDELLLLNKTGSSDH
jgi:hypothetical protein